MNIVLPGKWAKASVLIFCCFLFQFSGATHIRDQTLSASQLTELLLLDKGDTLIFTNCTLLPSDNQLDYIFSGYGLTLVRSFVRFEDCVFGSESGMLDGNAFKLSRFEFQSALQFSKCRGDLTIESGVVESLRLVECRFNKLKLSSMTLMYQHSTRDNFMDGCDIRDVTFETCHIISDQGFTFARSDMESLSITYSDFSNVSPYGGRANLHNSDFFDFFHVNLGDLEITDSNFDLALSLQFMTVDKSVELSRNTFHKVIHIQKLKIPADETFISYTDIKDKVVDIYNETDTTFSTLSYASVEDFDEQFSSYYRTSGYLGDYKEMLAFYSRLLTVFSGNSDLEAKNWCYKKLKDIEKNASQYLYGKNQTIESYFQWRMNQFLERFCDYGTNPVKSLVFSFYWILFFCAVYVVFPSEGDNLSFRKLFRAVQRYIDQFSDRSQEAPAGDPQPDEELTRFRNSLHENKGKLPPTVYLFGRPLYNIAVFLSRIKKRVVDFVEFNIYSDWQTLTKWKRIKTSILISLSLLGFLLWGLIMRLLNAIALSMNAFVTLGYGEIEASGVARYFCVLEGIVGWFLLSIFSVSLIGQILQ